MDRYLQKILGRAGRDLLFKLLRKKTFKVNGARITSGERFLEPGDVVEVFLSDESFEKLKTAPELLEARPLPMPIVYEDDHLLVVDKPVGMLTHPTKEEYKDTAATHVLHYLKSCVTPTFRPAPISRLDQNTSGLLVFAKDYATLKRWNQAMRERSIEKYYLAVVHGRIGQDRGSIRGMIEKDESMNRSTVRSSQSVPSRIPSHGRSHSSPRVAVAREVHTDYRVLRRFDDFTLVEAKLITGRSHQIRASFASIGHPLVGDLKYGGRIVSGIRSQLLHCHRLQLGDAEFVSPSREIDTFIGRYR